MALGNTTICSAAKGQRDRVSNREGGDDLDHRPQTLRPKHDRGKECDVIVAEKDVLDTGLDEPPDHLECRRPRTGQSDLGRSAVEGKLALAALGCDDSQMSCGRIHVVKQGRAIAQLAAIQWTGPCHRHQNVGVGRQCRSWPRRALLPAGKDCNVVANVGEH